MTIGEIRTFRCLRCDGNLRVVDSRSTNFMGEKTIIRRRRCLNCDHRFTTYEISEENLVKNMEIAERAVKFAKSIVNP